jgi:restriction endonuclease Mrr
VIPNLDTLFLPILRALGSGAVLDFRSIHADVKWKLGLSAEEVERLLPSGRTEVSVGVSEVLQTMIGLGLVANPSRAHYQITEAGKQRLETGAIR